MNKLHSDSYAIVINLHKTFAGEHIFTFNAPVLADVAGIIVDYCTATQEIVIRRRNYNSLLIHTIRVTL